MHFVANLEISVSDRLCFTTEGATGGAAIAGEWCLAIYVRSGVDESMATSFAIDSANYIAILDFLRRSKKFIHIIMMRPTSDSPISTL